MFNTKNIIFGVIALVVLVGIPVSLFLLQNQQDTRSRASDEGITGGIPSPSPTPPVGQGAASGQTQQQVGAGEQQASTQQASCQSPGPVSNVVVDFPNCDDTGNCSFTDANCSWSPEPNAQTYVLKIFQVESGEVVLQGPRSAQDETKVVFPVEQNKTYQCEVQSQNSCGQVGVAGTDALLCETGGVFPEQPTPTSAPLPTPTLTPTPIATPTPTIPTKPTNTPVPTVMEEPGSFGTTVGIIGGLGIVVIIGAVLLAL